MPAIILTATGNHFDVQHPDPSSIEILDIAHALSNLCRFTGHTSDFYSVAQHSVIVSRLVPKHLALEGLLHDASEAYLGDVSSPFKALLPDYQRIEKTVQNVIAERFDLKHPFPSEIHHADMTALASERRDLMPDARTQFQEIDEELWAAISRYSCVPQRIVPLPPAAAMALFLDRYEEIRLTDHLRWKNAMKTQSASQRPSSFR